MKSIGLEDQVVPQPSSRFRPLRGYHNLGRFRRIRDLQHQQQPTPRLPRMQFSTDARLRPLYYPEQYSAEAKSADSLAAKPGSGRKNRDHPSTNIE